MIKNIVFDMGKVLELAKGNHKSLIEATLNA